MPVVSPPALWLSAVDPVVQARTGSTSSQDYMSLFNSDNVAWSTVSDNTAVFMITTQFALWASDAELTAVISYLNEHHIELGLAGLMLSYQSDGIGSGVEGYSTPGTMAAVASRIAALGGNVSVLEMDEPLEFGHEYTGLDSEQASIQAVADQVAVNVKAVEQVFPDVQVGDAEPVPTTPLVDIQNWLNAYQQATGQQLTFLDADMQWYTNWHPGLEALSATLAAADVGLGIIYNGDSDATTGAQWVAEAVQHIADVQADSMITVRHAFVETWDPQPAYVLPDSTLGTLTNLALTYLAIAPGLIPSTVDGTTTEPLELACPSGAWALPGGSIQLSLLGLNLDGPAAARYTIVLSSEGGTIQASQIGSATVSGSGSGFTLLTGDLADISLELANSAFVASNAQSAVLEIAAVDDNGQSQVTTLPVTIGQIVPLPSQTPYSPVLIETEVSVASLYEAIYNRAPDTPGLASATSELMAGQLTLAQLRQIMATSPEAISHITLAYEGIFGRSPTELELTTAEDDLSSGIPLATIETPWLTVATNDVTALYQQVLGRQPDQGGLASFTNYMLEGHTLQEVRQIVASSAEAANNISTLVHQYAGRAPTAAELAELAQCLASNSNSLQQLTALITSADSTAAASDIVALIAESASSPVNTIIATLDATIWIPAQTPSVDLPTSLILVQPGTYDLTQRNSDGSSIMLPDGTPVALAGLSVETIGGAPITIKLLAADAGIPVAGSTMGPHPVLDIAGPISAIVTLNGNDTNLTTTLGQPGDVIAPMGHDLDFTQSSRIGFIHYATTESGLPASLSPAVAMYASQDGSNIVVRATAEDLDHNLIAFPFVQGETAAIAVTDLDPTHSSIVDSFQSWFVSGHLLFVQELAVSDGTRNADFAVWGPSVLGSGSASLRADPISGIDISWQT